MLPLNIDLTVHCNNNPEEIEIAQYLPTQPLEKI
jgi:hypothetical protein